jgi:hypothetical protein
LKIISNSFATSACKSTFKNSKKYNSTDQFLNLLSRNYQFESYKPQAHGSGSLQSY